MPTIHTEKGYQFFFSNEGNEPCHVHVRGKGGIMKVWLPEVIVADVRGYSPREQRDILEIIRNKKEKFVEEWNEFFSKKSKPERIYPAIKDLKIGKDTITAVLDDGREVSIPIAWSERLSNASGAQLKKFEIDPYGYGIHWPDVDEDISIKAFIDGWNSPRTDNE